MILALVFIAHLSSAADNLPGATMQGSVESTVEGAGISSENSTRTAIAALGPELSSTLMVGTTAIVATAITYVKWDEAETRRRYREAAAEGRERLARGEETPISNADPESSLRLVAELERMANRDKLQYPEYVSEGNVVRLIVARAKQLE